MPLLRILLGAALLTAGRNLFWLFLGVVGFILGFDVAERLLQGQQQGTIFVIALIAGVVCGLLAVLIQKFAILIGGFIAGAYLLPALLKEFGLAPGHYYWLFFFIGGLGGAFMLKVFFNWALIVLSCVVGSDLIVQSLHFTPQLRKVLFVFLLLIGIVIQADMTRRKSALHHRS
jgi:hypothetical protein